MKEKSTIIYFKRASALAISHANDQNTFAIQFNSAIFFSVNICFEFVLFLCCFWGLKHFFDFGRNKSSKMRKKVCVLVLQLESKKMLSPMEQKKTVIFIHLQPHCFVFF